MQKQNSEPQVGLSNINTVDKEEFMSTDYRKIWIQYNGSIPVDDSGRTYEIHHIDGNKSNNNIDNLVLVANQSEHVKKYHPDLLIKYQFKKERYW